jgi:AmmeMemoRadiSam system protein B/AmmeMemoRadiSam system protein A
MKWKVWLAVGALALAGCGGDKNGNGDSNDGSSQGGIAGKDVREAAVAGLWYPGDAETLGKFVDALLTAATQKVPGKVRALICPHAGYRYSGVTAAAAYKQLLGSDVDTAIVLAPSHTGFFRGASIPAVKAYRTPLGLIPLSPRARELAGVPPFSLEVKTSVKRPDWWQKAPKEAPPYGQDTPHTWEWSLESQLPFLQRALSKFQLVPALCGEVDPVQMAEVLAPRLDGRTVVIASSDLSHYHPYSMAKSLDLWCVKAVRELDVKAMAQQEACGKSAILAVMHLAKKKGWKPVVLDYRNSGDIPKGNRDRVVGYMSAVFVEEGAKDGTPLTDADRRILLDLARKSAAAAAGNKPLPAVERSLLSRQLLAPKAVFVTLHKDGKLRGCIGYTAAVKPLYQAVIEAAANAAVRDRRFLPLKPEELPGIRLEVSILGEPKAIYYNQPSDLLARLRPKIDGVVLEVPVVLRGRRGVARGVYLPSVWEEIPDPEKFMQSLSRNKAGLSPDAWRQPAARVRIFQVEAFQEPKG